MNSSIARARTNIALVKYWGKLDKAVNLPATGSISMTLSGMSTTTKVTFDDGLERDELVLNGMTSSENARLKVGRFMDLVRGIGGFDSRALVESENNFPTAGGLASSASGFAALTAAAVKAAGLDLSHGELSELARKGSGSAPRSLLGGFVELGAGSIDGSHDCVPVQIAPEDHWDLRMLVAITFDGEKDIGYTEGMERTRLTSPYYDAWIASHPKDMRLARRAIKDKNFHELGCVMENSCFKMHAVAFASSPPLMYWNPATIAVIKKVWELRRDGLEGFLTIDAGPHVKVLCEAKSSGRLAAELSNMPMVNRVHVEKPGPGVEYLA